MKRILITPGEPAGIGPDITVQLAQQPWPVQVIAIADPRLLQQRAHLLNLPLHLIECPDLSAAPRRSHQPGTLIVLPLSLATQAIPGQLTTANADYVIRTLTLAANACLSHQADAIVTGPIHKEVINQALIPFTGHTEFLANCCQVPKTVMLFVVDQLKVALATTHLPLSQVSHAITRESLAATLTILRQSLQQSFGMAEPNILVCGLNPHAGEGGYLGHEEIDTIAPTLEALRQQGYQLQGPLPADTVFTPRQLETADAVLAMYHDQALPLVKHIGFGQAVNVTLGLPFIRTSVDHGTALDLAGTGTADAFSLIAAMQLAIRLCHSPL